MTTEEKLKVLKIIKKSPFVFESIFNSSKIPLKNKEEFKRNYLFGTITESEIKLVKEFLEDDK